MVKRKAKRISTQKKVYRSAYQKLRAQEKKTRLSEKRKLFAKREAIRKSRFEKANRPKFKIVVPPLPKRPELLIEEPTNWQEQQAYDEAKKNAELVYQRNMRERNKFIEEQKQRARIEGKLMKEQEFEAKVREFEAKVIKAEAKVRKALPKKQAREFSQGITRNLLTKKERAEGKIEGEVDRLTSRALAVSDYATKKMSFSARVGSRKESKYRARAVQGLLGATGISGKQTYKGAGRPRGTYKYGMPIQVYKAQMRQKRALYEQYQQEQAMRLKPRGFSQEQLQQLQQQQTYEELEQPTQRQIVGQMQRQIVRQEPPQREYQKMRVPTNTKYVEPGPSVADEELNFRKWSAEQTISPNTQRILDTIRRIQNKGKSDNIEQQRRIRERNMVMKSMNLMKAHENMIDTSMDFTKVDMNENILGAPNVFKQNGSQLNILRTDRPNILQTKLTGNSLFF
jgi:hypothetical protein